ncbi:MAG: quinolinate synthase NadA [Propionibacteriaceae bacterium]|jgi:quinolinate synthase|nr:quinolinate synthase NadA [Propionibacteriaceae bacterium]
MPVLTPTRPRARLPLADAAFQRVCHVVPAVEWATMADDVEAIWRLKRQRNAVILAHNYMTPEIFHGVADITGDSLALARQAASVDADVIVLAGVHFMAETAKLLNPDKTVLIPDLRSGCSLAESITAEDVQALKQAHPGVPVVAYVNTSAAVKAESDICCTSGNAEEVVRSLGVERLIMIPDQYLAANIAAKTGVEVITHPGACEVHERFTPRDIEQIRLDHPGVTVLAHPECPPPVVQAADYAGSTADMVEYVAGIEPGAQPATVALITECSMSDNVAQLYPGVAFVRPCNLCPHMKRNTLGSIRRSLETMTHEVALRPETAARALAAVQRMLEV